VKVAFKCLIRKDNFSLETAGYRLCQYLTESDNYFSVCKSSIALKLMGTVVPLQMDIMMSSIFLVCMSKDDGECGHMEEGSSDGGRAYSSSCKLALC
jgi:hypothetical protein